MRSAARLPIHQHLALSGRLLGLVLCLALLLPACTARMYEGPALPDTEVAVIDGHESHGIAVMVVWVIPAPVPQHRTSVLSVDGRPRDLGTDVEVLPGPHRVKVRYTRAPDANFCVAGSYGLGVCVEEDMTYELEIEFAAEAGHRYRVLAERQGRNYIWVEDTDSGQLVAGERPSAAPAVTPEEQAEADESAREERSSDAGAPANSQSSESPDEHALALEQGKFEAWYAGNAEELEYRLHRILLDQPGLISQGGGTQKARITGIEVVEVRGDGYVVDISWWRPSAHTGNEISRTDRFRLVIVNDALIKMDPLGQSS